VIVIGVGSAWRGDDAAGLAVARRVGGLPHEGDATTLLDAWAWARHAVVIDAARSGAPPGSVRWFDVTTAPLPARAVRSSTHAFGLPDAIELARALGRLPGRLEVCAIEGADFRAGAPLSAAVARAVDRLAASLRPERRLTSS
jgi:hydrogenase maturation protease